MHCVGLLRWHARHADLLALPAASLPVTAPPPPTGVYCPLNQARGAVPVVPLGTCYTLSAREFADCIAVGRERNARNLAEHRQNRNYSGRSDEDISVQGVLAEYAFARLFALPVEIYDTTCRSVRDDTFDGTMPTAEKVDVKCTLYDRAELRVTDWKRSNPPQYYALLIYMNADRSRALDAQAPLPVLSFRGFVRAETLFRDEHRQQIAQRGGHGETKCYYCVAQSALRTWEQLQPPCASSSS